MAIQRSSFLISSGVSSGISLSRLMVALVILCQGTEVGDESPSLKRLFRTSVIYCLLYPQVTNTRPLSQNM